MKKLIDKMRSDFVQVAAARVAAGLWGDEDEEMAGQAIKAALDGDDQDLLLCWARWLAVLSARDLLETKVPPVAPVAPRACDTCAHFTRPGSSAGYCNGREDLKRAYGENHPLRVLPSDGGASCMRWRKRS